MIIYARNIKDCKLVLLLTFTTSCLADGQFVIHALFSFRIFDLNGQTKHLVEEFLCFAYFHRSFDLQLVITLCSDIFSGLFVQRSQSHLWVCELSTFVNSESYTESFFEIRTNSFLLFVRGHRELCVRKVVFNRIEKSHSELF